MTVHLITFCDSSMTHAADLCVKSAQEHGVDSTIIWTQDALKQTEFYRENKVLLDQPRGAGLWSWKPWIILQFMLGRVSGEQAVSNPVQIPEENDVIVYSDAGIEFIDNLKFIIDRMRPGEDIFLFGNTWQHVDWCKADTIHAILPDAKFEDFGFQVQASLIFLRVSQWSRDFVSEWLSYCIQPHIIDDSPSVAPNAPTFREHRHDQSILHCLSVRHRVPLHWYPVVYNRFSGPMFVHEKGEHLDIYPPLAHHHRLRNHEFDAIP